MGRQNDLRNDPVLALTFKLVLPAMLAQLVNVLYGIVDRMFIGHIPLYGDLALAGVGVCGPIVTLISSFGTLVGIGGSIKMATEMGRGDEKEAKRILSNSFLMLLIFSALLTVTLLLTKRQMIYFFGGSDATFAYADSYLTIYNCGTFFALLAMGLNSFISCQGFSLSAMLTVIIGAVSNIILDAVFVPGLGMGVEGAAIATVISQCFSCCYALFFLFGKRVKVRISFGGYDFKLMRRILSLGLSPFIILATDSLTIIAMNMCLQHYGGAQGDMLITAVTVVQSYFLLITGPLLGISGGVQPIISFNYGAGQSERVRKTVKYALTMGVVFTAAMFLLSRFCGGYFVSFFTDSKESADTAVWGIKVFTLSIVPLAFQYVCVDSLTAMGRVKTALYLSISRKLFYLLVTLLLAKFIAAENAFYSESVADFVCAVQSTLVFSLVFRKYLRSTPAETPDSARLHSGLGHMNHHGGKRPLHAG